MHRDNSSEPSNLGDTQQSKEDNVSNSSVEQNKGLRRGTEHTEPEGRRYTAPSGSRWGDSGWRIVGDGDNDNEGEGRWIKRERTIRGGEGRTDSAREGCVAGREGRC